MDFTDPEQKKVFFDVHNGLPREGPGSRQSTEKALKLAGPLPRQPKVLDIACGPGKQTLDLAELVPDGIFVAVDTHRPFLDDLMARATEKNSQSRIEVKQTDMAALPFEDESFDLIWCEGGAYFMGLLEAVQAWSPLLHSGGKMAITEPVWLRADAPDNVQELFREYPAMRNISGCRALLKESPLKLLGDFVLPQSDWSDDYYKPMKHRLKELSPSYRGNKVAESVLKECEEEISFYEEFSTYYGYSFFVMSK